MKLVASMICRNEMHRYLPLMIQHTAAYVDEIRVLDDGSTDGTYEWLLNAPMVKVKRNEGPGFADNEGMARQELFTWTLEGEPTHILAIDADEFVSDGQKLRKALKSDPDVPVWSLLVCEVWKAELEMLWLRVDGYWPPLRAPVLYKVPATIEGEWRIPPRKLASGREPRAVVDLALRGEKIDLSVDLLHWGWANESQRQARYLRYVAEDGGSFHDRGHIESIIREAGVQLEAMYWPHSMTLCRKDVLEVVRSA